MMRDRHAAWTDQFSDYLSGEMPEAERHRVEQHVAVCGPCREILAELGAVLALAAGAERLEPPRDLWPGVAASIGGKPPVRDARDGVIALPTTSAVAGPTPAASRVRLAFAAVLLVAASVTTTWWVASGGAAGPGPEVTQALPPASLGAASELRPADDLADQLRVLELFLASARETLDPGTVLVLERNLNAIESAITDSRDALALDPGNGFLMEHLERMYQRKLLYLQDAVRVAEWAG